MLPEKGIARKGRLAESCRDHGLLHLLDAHADALDLVQAEEEVRNQLVPPDRNRAEIPNRQAFRQAAGVHDLHPVIIDLHADLRAGDAVVAVHEGIHQGLAQNLERDLVNVLPIDTPDFAADVQMFLEEGNGLIELGEQIVPHIATVVDVEPVRSLERQERHLCLMQVVIDVLGEEENARVFDTRSRRQP